jgi:hypothetical protein
MGKSADLARVRQLAHDRNHTQVLSCVEEIRAEHGTYLALTEKMRLRLFAKVAAKPDKFVERSGPLTYSVLFVYDENGLLLVVNRGPYKRAFPRKFTVGACGYSPDPKSLARAFLTDTGVTVDSGRLARLGPALTMGLFSREFWAVTPDELARIQTAHRRYSGHPVPGIRLDISLRKQSLSIFALSPSDVPELDRLAEDIARETGIPPIHPINDAGAVTPYSVRLTAGETAAVRAAGTARFVRFLQASERPESELCDGDLADLDRDLLLFLDPSEVVYLFEREPLRFALDLCAPVLSSPDLRDVLRRPVW